MPPPSQDAVKQESSLSAMRKGMLPGNGVNTAYQVLLENRYTERAQRLGYTNRNPLFQTFTEILDPAAHSPNLHGQASEILGIKPLDDATLVLCDLVYEKYGVRIHALLPNIAARPSNEQINRWLDAAQGQPIGLVVPSSVRRPVVNYCGHVVPYLLQKTPHGIQIMNMDSLPKSQPNVLMMDFMRVQSAANIDAIEFAADDKRQTSQNGCKVDAIQLLKDALLHYKHGQFDNIYNFMGGATQGRVYNPKQIAPHCVTASMKMPSVLHKTAQRSHFFNTQNHEANTPLLSGETIGEHRAKYTGPLNAVGVFVSPESKLGNHFLVVKSYYQIGKVLNKLESFDSAADRQQYIRQLKN